MSASQRKITPADILSDADYAAKRNALRKESIAAKKNRRVEVGPFATFYFENYQSMWLQVQEMLRIEKGGAQQMRDEIEVYNPLIPQGYELIATMMLEIDDEKRRNAVLLTLGGVEETAFVEIDGERIQATPTEYEGRTTPDGKTSSVHWLRFALTSTQIAAWRGGTRTLLGIAHPHYGHMAVLTSAVQEALALDFA